MKKKLINEEIKLIRIDQITGEYCISIPEWMTNELSWYEDTEIKIILDGNEIIISEN